MEFNRSLKPVSLVLPMTPERIASIEAAKKQQDALQKSYAKEGKGAPPFELVEMIGKGSYGRVYKAKYLEPPHNVHEYVAVKVINADQQDYATDFLDRDNSFKDFNNELHILKVLSETKARNINKVLEAFVSHSQLIWITEYCPGGSVRTIMGAQPGKRLSERYVIPVAREMAIGLKCVHDAGIIHRDVKAANVLIHENGRVELCDFGTSIMLIGEKDKRSTIIGTPHWMPLEMHEASEKRQTEYRTEVDSWAYGCTIYELLTGMPPNAGKQANRQLEVSLRRSPPRLTGDEYSDGAKAFIDFILKTDPRQRPSVKEILNHPYIKDTEETHPISLLTDLVADVIRFRQEGGQRASLLHPGGAMAAEANEDLNREFRDSWNFSTTESFYNRHSRLFDPSVMASLPETDESTPTSSALQELTPIERKNFDERVRRGAEAMGGIFEPSKPEYKYTAKRDFRELKETKRISDLPLRDATDRSSVRDTQIDLGDFDPSHYVGETGTTYPVIQLADADTIRANRSNSRLFREASEQQLTAKSSSDLDEYAVSSIDDNTKRPPTQEWKFPDFMQPDGESESGSAAEETVPPPKRSTLAWTFPKEALEDDMSPPSRPTLKHAATVPINLPSDAMVQSSLLASSPPPPPGDSSQDDNSYESEPCRPSTASSMSSDADYDPFKFDLDSDLPSLPPELREARMSMNSEINQMLADSGYGTIRGRTTVADMTGFMDAHPEFRNPYTSIYGPDAPEPQLMETPALGSPDFPGQNLSLSALTSIPGNQTATTTAAATTTTTTAASGAAAAAAAAAVAAATNDQPSSINNIAIEFPNIVMPSAEALMEGASDDVMALELDRLLSDWVTGVDAVEKVLGELPPEDGTTNADIEEVWEDDIQDPDGSDDD